MKIQGGTQCRAAAVCHLAGPSHRSKKKSWSMNKYLAKLHSLQPGSSAQNPKTRHHDLPSKPSEPGFEGFEGDVSRRIFENRDYPTVTDPCAERGTENAKTGTVDHPQNPQNLRSPSVPAAAEPSSTGCKVEIVELPQAPRYRKVFGFLQLRPPALIPENRWRLCVSDGSRFLAKWGDQAEALGWTSADLFGLHTPPAEPHLSYSRLSRYDWTGLVWLLQGRPVVALTATAATIRNPATGAITTYRRFNKPALGPLGDSLDELQ